MSTDRETTRLVRSWLEEGVTRLPDRVLDSVLDQVPATQQRRHWWSAWRSNTMQTYAKVVAAAAAVLLVAVVGYQFLPRNSGVGGQPTIAPSPSPSLLAKGTFRLVGRDVELDATGGADSVTGRLAVSGREGAFSVDLKCARTTEAGLLWITGDVTESTDANALKGTRAGIILEGGPPAQGIFVFQFNDPQSASCQAFIDDMIASIEGPMQLMPIAGSVVLGS